MLHGEASLLHQFMGTRPFPVPVWTPVAHSLLFLASSLPASVVSGTGVAGTVKVKWPSGWALFWVLGPKIQFPCKQRSYGSHESEPAGSHLRALSHCLAICVMARYTLSLISQSTQSSSPAFSATFILRTCVVCYMFQGLICLQVPDPYHMGYHSGLLPPLPFTLAYFFPTFLVWVNMLFTGGWEFWIFQSYTSLLFIPKANSERLAKILLFSS